MAEIYEDVFKASQLLEAELIGKGCTASSLASELQSATSPSSSTSLSSDPLHSFHIVNKVDSHRLSIDSNTVEITIDEDPFEMLKGQLEELNSAVCETKTLHKKLCSALSLDNSLSMKKSSTETSVATGSYTPPLELLIASVVSLIDRKSRDRERQTNYLKTIDSSIRRSSKWMTIDLIKELEQVTINLRHTLYDHTYTFANPLPIIRCLTTDTTSTAQSMEELKELMFVNKHQVQELNVRLRAIAKTVHDVRKDTRKLSQFFQSTHYSTDSEDDVDEQQQQQLAFLEKGQLQQKVEEIMCGLDELDTKYSKKSFLFI